MATLMDKRVVVIGGSSGIGLGVAAAACNSGAEVVIVGRSPEKLQAAERMLAGDGRVATLNIDVVRRFVDNKLIGAILAAKHAARTLKTGGSMTFTSGINKDSRRFPEARSCPRSPARSATSPTPCRWSSRHRA